MAYLHMPFQKRVKVEFDGVGPSARTLQQYANDGIAGVSPLKPGV